MFHAKDNWYFSRNEDGSVTIEKRTYGLEDNGQLSYSANAKGTFSANEWASIVASVSRGGDTSDMWVLAYNLHYK